MILLLLLAAIGNFTFGGIQGQAVGRGQPLVVIHGGPGLTKDYLLPQLYRLAQDNFVIFYDQGDRETLEGLIEDVETIRTKFQYSKISLLGHSWGGYVAMQYAIAHPDRVEKLILANSEPADFEGYTSFGEEWMRRMAPCQESLEAIQKREGFAEGDTDVNEQYMRTMFRAYCYCPDDANKLTLRLTPKQNLLCAKILPLLSEKCLQKPYSLCNSLKALQIPTLIIHGENDIIPLQTARKIHECIAGSEYVVIPHCGHFPYVEQPDLFFNKIRAFLCDDAPDFLN